MEERQLIIKDCCVWDTSKSFAYLKGMPKNGQIRYCHIDNV